MIFEPHSMKQQNLILSDSDLTIAATGTQWGKSQAGTIWMQRQIFEHNNPKDNFIIGAPTYKILNQSILPYFLRHMGESGDFNKSDSVFKVHHGGTVYFRTETDPDSIVGIPNVKAGWLDEAGKLRLYFWENYQARAASKGAKTLLTTSPYSLNWMYKNYIKPYINGYRNEDLTIIQASSWENPFHELHDPAKRKKALNSMDKRRFDMIFGGEWGQMIGLVYNCFSEEANVCNTFQLPTGTKYYGGIDWGYDPDPFVLLVRAILPSGHHIQVSESVAKRHTITDMINLAKQKMTIFNIERFFADPSQPGYIEEFNRNKLPTIGADNDIRMGIDRHYELIKNGLFRIFKDTSPVTLDELSTYHYPEPQDLKSDQDQKPTLPVGQNDHCMDAMRYLTMMTYKNNIKHIPKMPSENKNEIMLDHEKRIKHLKKLKKQFNGSESW